MVFIHIKNMKDIEEWIDYSWSVLPKVCYISIQLVDGDYDLDVETSQGDIGYGTGSNNLHYAISVANELEDEFNKRGVKVVNGKIKKSESVVA